MDFVRLAKGLQKEIVALRRDFHAHPEAGLKEHRTAAAVEKYLRALGIKTKRMAGTGVAGYLDVRGAKRTIALRADIDALPLTEETKVPYASRVPGLMHACGHDAHTAMLLAVAKMLASHKSELAGNVRFIFQPNEEFPPGGAKAMVDEGVMDGVEEVYGVHVWSNQPSGRFGIEAGPQFANVDDVRVKIIGKGAHGAGPEHSIDPVLTASQAIVALQQIVARNVAPTVPAVLSICMINAGTAYNIIPQTCFFRGTVRTFTKSMRAAMPRMIRRVVSGVAKAHGARFEMEYLAGYDAVVNDARATRAASAAAISLFGRAALVSEGPQMGAEDFCEYAKCAPGCFIRMGTGNRAKRTDVAHHNPKFNVDESVLWMGAALLAKLAVERGARK
jgi:amidohydrolase